MSIITKQVHHNKRNNSNNPLSAFVYALKDPETRRQYPRRLKVFLDFLNLGTEVLEDQARIFLLKPKYIRYGLRIPFRILWYFKNGEFNSEKYLIQLFRITIKQRNYFAK